MKFLLLLLILNSYLSRGQCDTLLFRSLEKIISTETKIVYRDEIYLSVNKLDLGRIKIKDTTLINVNGRNYKLILLKEPTEKKDFYVLPTDYNNDNYIVFRIQNCNQPRDKTFTISYVKELTEFIPSSFDVMDLTPQEIYY